MATNQQALGRLTASETASLIAREIGASADDDMMAAMSRIIGKLNIKIVQVKFVYGDLMHQLQNADLTINFFAYKFFNKKPKIEKYVSQFEGGDTWGDPTYMSSRDEAEEAMFDYSGANPRPNADAGVNAAQGRVTQLGTRGGNDFEGAVRPKYAALNYANLKYGSAGQWGKSYMILRDYIKHNATFVHTDSFDVSGSARQRATLRGQLANFLHMQRLIVNMADPMLLALYNASRGVSLGEATQPPNLGDTAYIEAHCHAEIQFERDIKTMVICQDEADESDAQTTKLHTKTPDRFKVVSTKKLKERMQKFADKYGIELKYI